MSFNSFTNLADVARNGGFTLSEDFNNVGNLRVDWRFLAAIDVSRIIEESNFEKLDECIPFLLKSSLSNVLNSRILDPAIIKIFTLSQLALQYLLFSTRFLDKSVLSLRENLYVYQQKCSDLHDELKDYEKEMQKLRKMANVQKEIFPCIKCTKSFENLSLLESHMIRKHNEKEQDKNLIKAIKLELEIKGLKEKLNYTEKELMEVKIMECQKCLENQSRIFKNVGIQINSEDKEVDEMEKEHVADKFKEFNDTIYNLMTDLNQFKEENRESGKQLKTIVRDAVEKIKQNYQKPLGYKEQFDEFKTMLDEAIKSLKQKESNQNPLPALRYINIGVQASDESYTELQTKNLIIQQESENLWKMRFKELEEMYERNQRQMAKSMKDLERAYSEKLRNLEKSVLYLKNESLLNTEIRQKDIVPHVRIRKQSTSSSSGMSSDDEIIEDKIPVKAVANSPNLTAPKSTIVPVKKSKNIFSAQKWFKKIDKAPKTNESTNKIENNNLDRAKELLMDHLKTYDVQKHSKNMSKKNIEAIQSNLANQREIKRKLYPNFFINRKKIRERVDLLYANRKHVLSNKKSDEDQEKPKKKVFFRLQRKLIKPDVSDSDFDITSLDNDDPK